MQTVMRGRVILLDRDNIDTDVITPAHWCIQTMGDKTLAELRPHAFEAFRPELNDIVRPGDIFVAGKNFGTGSHREQALQILKLWGVQAFVAESIARIYFRNAIAFGLPAFNLPGVTAMFREGEEMEIDLRQWTITNLTRGERMAVPPFPPTVMRILEAGGIAALLKQRIDAEARPGGGAVFSPSQP